jgi:hypothetical protein
VGGGVTIAAANRLAIGLSREYPGLDDARRASHALRGGRASSRPSPEGSALAITP